MQRVRMQLGMSDAYMEKLTGPSVVVAVLDSGMVLHPDLRDSLLCFRDFVGKKIRCGERVLMHTPYDENGHGTHICGIISGTGKCSQGKYKGIFPGTGLVVGKVLDEVGDGSAENMLRGMEWVLSLRRRYDIRILNISVGVSRMRDPTKEKRLQHMMRKLSEEGILVVCAAGNKGPASGTLSSLGEPEQVIAVGCNDGTYYRGDPSRCAVYSGCGRLHGVPRKPDIVAPGTRIISCGRDYEKVQLQYTAKSGTSMAAPIVTACLARVLQKEPDLTVSELRQLLTKTARNLGEPWNRQGWGMVQPREMLRLAKRG